MALAFVAAANAMEGSEARAGGRAAFETVMRQYERQVLGTAMRLLGNMEDAKDASQEVFLRLYRNLGKVEAHQNFQGWLYRVTVNVCYDMGRKRKRSVSMEGVPDPASAADDPQQSAAGAERQRVLAMGLRTLSSKERAALVLRDLEGLSTEEVARTLGTSEATVRSQISKARVKMRGFRGALLPEAVMNCGEWEERIALYAGGDLPPSEAQAVEQHVAECAGCQMSLSGLRGSMEWLREAHGEPVDAAHFTAVRARVLAELDRAASPWWRQVWVYALVAAAMVLLIAVWLRPPKSMVVPMPPAPVAPMAQVIRAPIAPPLHHRKRPRKIEVKAEEPEERLVVKLLTDDPNVIIYWISDSKGE